MSPASRKISCAMATMIVQMEKTKWNAKKCESSQRIGKNLIGMITDDTQYYEIKLTGWCNYTFVKLLLRSGAGEVMQRFYGVWHTLCYPSILTSQEEATNVCRMSGYSDGIIKYQTFDKPVVPSRDDFYMVRLSSTTWITMRDDKPLITLVQSEKPCYRLFVKCN